MVGSRATVRLTTTITTAAITSDHPHHLATRRSFGCCGVPPPPGGAPNSAMDRHVLLSLAAIIEASVSPTRTPVWSDPTMRPQSRPLNTVECVTPNSSPESLVGATDNNLRQGRVLQ